MTMWIAKWRRDGADHPDYINRRRTVGVERQNLWLRDHLGLTDAMTGWREAARAQAEQDARIEAAYAAITASMDTADVA